MSYYQIRKFFKQHKISLLLLSIITLLGFGFKFYTGPLQGWFNDYGAGLLYEIFWCLFFFILFPSPKYRTRICVSVFGITSLLEFLQLWHPPFLEATRSTFPGQALIGTSFSWWDFPHYAVGCYLGYILIKLLTRTYRVQSS